MFELSSTNDVIQVLRSVFSSEKVGAPVCAFVDIIADPESKLKMPPTSPGSLDWSKMSATLKVW